MNQPEIHQINYMIIHNKIVTDGVIDQSGSSRPKRIHRVPMKFQDYL